jgi:hypothetical protein
LQQDESFEKPDTLAPSQHDDSDDNDDDDAAPNDDDDEDDEDNGDDGFGDDFDDFEEGNEDDDFDDFEDGFQEAETPAPVAVQPQLQSTLPFVRNSQNSAYVPLTDQVLSSPYLTLTSLIQTQL